MRAAFLFALTAGLGEVISDEFRQGLMHVPCMSSLDEGRHCTGQGDGTAGQDVKDLSTIRADRENYSSASDAYVPGFYWQLPHAADLRGSQHIGSTSQLTTASYQHQILR